MLTAMSKSQVQGNGQLSQAEINKLRNDDSWRNAGTKATQIVNADAKTLSEIKGQYK